MEITTIKDRNELYGAAAEYKNCNMFIEAGAGAGKTETIINLIVSQLYRGVSPERIVVITFTNKATEELIGRVNSIISDKLSELGKNPDKNGEQICILKNAINNLYKMNISTIHHFCNVILNENSYEAKLSFNSTLLEEEDEEKRRNSFYYRWLHSLPKSDIGIIAGSSDDAFKNLKSTYDALCNQFDDIDVKAEVIFDYDKFVDKIFELYNLLKKYVGLAELGSYAIKFCDKVACIEGLYGKEENKVLFEKFVENESLKTIRTDIILKSNKKFRLSKEEIKDINETIIRPEAEECVEIKELAKIFIADSEYKVTNYYAIKAWEAYKKARDRESLCNNQLIFETYTLFNKNPEVKEKIAKQYDVIFVDEFQDTDKYQNKFIMDLALAIDKRKGLEGKESTSIVVVGDPKQSIYGFRGADFELFMERRGDFGACGLNKAVNIYLPENYRSNQFILNWVNDTYREKIFYDGYKYEDMILPKENEVPEKDEDGKALAGVYNYNFSKGDDKFANYASLVKYIKEKKKIYKKNKDGIIESQKIRYSDFLILTTSHSEINQFIMAFNRENIKTLVAGEFDLCASPAVNYIYRILMFVLDKENNNRRLFAGNFNSDIYDEKKLSDIADAIKDYSPYGKLLYVFNNIDLILENFGESDKEMLKTMLAQICENVCYDDNASKASILDSVDKIIHTIQDAQLSIRPDEDAVRIMNVHQAKGLTAEIVIVADSGGFAPDKGCKVIDNSIYLNNLGLYPEINERYKINQSKEKLRLEYVMATRARQVIIFESSISDKQLFNREDEQYNFENLDKYNIKSELPEFEGCTDEQSDKHVEIIAPGTGKIDEALTVPYYTETSPSLLEKKGPAVDSKSKYLRPANNIFGTIFHRIMELYIVNPEWDIDFIIKRAMDENIKDIPTGETENYKKYLKECLAAVINLYEKTNLLYEYNIQEPEYKFCDFDETLYGDKPTLMTGSMDLLLKSDGKILIIDYKTDANHFETNEEFEKVLKVKYQDQLNTYKKIIGKVVGIDADKIEARIVWLEEKEKENVGHFVSI